MFELIFCVACYVLGDHSVVSAVWNVLTSHVSFRSILAELWSNSQLSLRRTSLELTLTVCLREVSGL